MDPRKKIDFLANEVMGDLVALMDRFEALPGMLDGAEQRLTEQAKGLIAAGSSIDRLIEEKAALAVARATDGARDKIQQAAIDSLSGIVDSSKASISSATNSTVQTIQNAGADADQRIGRMVTRLEHAGTTISWSIAGMFFAMIVGGMIGGSLMYFLLKTAGFLGRI